MYNRIYNSGGMILEKKQKHLGTRVKKKKNRWTKNHHNNEETTTTLL